MNLLAWNTIYRLVFLTHIGAALFGLDIDTTRGAQIN
jgi:hypothetical protein